MYDANWRKLQVRNFADNHTFNQGIITWISKTMYEEAKTSELEAGMRAYKIGIFGISETRWTSSGKDQCQKLLFSGNEGENATKTE